MAKRTKNVNVDISQDNPKVDIDRQQWQDLQRLIKETYGMKPKAVNAQITARTYFYKEELLNMAKGRFEVKCPEFWSKDFMLSLLLGKGRFFVADSAIGVSCFDGSAHGLNVYSRPSHITITNPVLHEFQNLIYYGQDMSLAMNEVGEALPYGVVVYLYDDKFYRSIRPTIDIYAQRLADVDASIDVNIMNTRIPYVFNVKNNKQANAAKRFFDGVTSGEPAIFIDMESAFSINEKNGKFVETMPAADNYIADKLTELKTDIKNEFLSRIGLNNTPYEKRERLLTGEVDSNNAEIESHIAYVKDNLKRCSENVRKVFGIDFDISIRENKGVDRLEINRLDGSGNTVQ